MADAIRSEEKVRRVREVLMQDHHTESRGRFSPEKCGPHPGLEAALAIRIRPSRRRRSSPWK